MFRVPVNDPEGAQEELNTFLRGHKIGTVRSDLVGAEAGAAYSFLKEHGIPVYAVFTNEQLAGIVRKPPTTLGELSAFEGVGTAKAEKFGAPVLDVLQESPSPAQDEREAGR